MHIQSGVWPEFVNATRSQSGPVVIDLSEASWADPVVIAGVAAVAQRAKVDQREVTFNTPLNPDAQGYLSRMRLGQALDALGVVHRLPAVNERDQKGNLLELRTFSNEHDGERLAEMVYDRVGEMSGIDKQVLEPLHAAITELAINTTYHAGVDHGYAVAQTYKRKGLIKFCVADAGVGLKESLERNGSLHPDDDAHALDMAVLRQHSGTDDAHRGYGLPEVVSSVRELGGATAIASGVASTRYVRDRKAGNVADVSYASTLSTPYSGVIVQVAIPWVPGR